MYGSRDLEKTSFYYSETTKFQFCVTWRTHLFFIESILETKAYLYVSTLLAFFSICFCTSYHTEVFIKYMIIDVHQDFIHIYTHIFHLCVCRTSHYSSPGSLLFLEQGIEAFANYRFGKAKEPISPPFSF